MQRPRTASAVLLLGTVLVAGCGEAPTATPLAPETEAAKQNLKEPNGASPDRVGPLPGVWVEPSPELRLAAIDGGIAVTDSHQMLGGLDLYVDPCRDVSDLTVRVAVMVDGEVVATGDSEGGIGVIREDFPGLDPGSDTAVTGPGTPACRGNREPVKLAANPEADGPRVMWPDPDDWWPDPDSWYPDPDNWDPHPDTWIPAGELIPDPDNWDGWPAKWSFLKAKKAFLKAKKAFVPAIVVFDEAHDWFAGNDRPIVAGGGFATRADDDRPQLGGAVVVVGVMPGDNVSVMPGDNVSVMPGDRVAPKVGVTFFAAGPGDDD
ncbi:MAG: hypothetical protein R6U63_14635 [Longimicrobiales bacterium]